MYKCILWGIIGSVAILCLAGGLRAEDEYVINNPNYDAYIKVHPLETKPRDPAVIAAEKKLIVEAAQAVVDYTKANGVEQAATEITKGVTGAFGQYCQIGPQFRIGIYQFTGA